jgi:uncharacterized protein YjbI with pentapeptide repeats
VVCIALIITGYLFDWTGFNGYNKVTTTTEITSPPPKITKTEEYQPGKRLWDWLQLLGIFAIPAVVGLGAAWYTAQQGKVSDRENTDNQRETLLQAYIDNMSELLLEKKLRDSAEDDEVRTIARVRTLTVLSRLDANRKASVLQLLYKPDLLAKSKPIIDLKSADLSRANLSGTYLREARLSEVNLNGANLEKADLNKASLPLAELSGANMREARLSEANMREADLSGARLSGADLVGVELYGARLSGADLSGARLRYASLIRADLREADLSKADLREANLERADLSGARLSGANLEKADLNEANLKGATGMTIGELEKQARSLQSTTMPDGSKHP